MILDKNNITTLYTKCGFVPKTTKKLVIPLLADIEIFVKNTSNQFVSDRMVYAAFFALTKGILNGMNQFITLFFVCLLFE